MGEVAGRSKVQRRRMEWISEERACEPGSEISLHGIKSVQLQYMKNIQSKWYSFFFPDDLVVN